MLNAIAIDGDIFRHVVYAKGQAVVAAFHGVRVKVQIIGIIAADIAEVYGDTGFFQIGKADIAS